MSRAGDYENISEYVRELIRRDKECSEAEAFERLKAELKQAFASPKGSFKNVAAADIIATRPHKGEQPPAQSCC